MTSIDATWYQRPEGVADETAAGGLVIRVNEQGLIAMALAREPSMALPVLPKGHVRRGETLEEAARREIAEETGLTAIELLGELGVRERLNYERTRWKTTHYFLYVTRQAHALPVDRRHPPLVWVLLDGRPSLAWPEQEELLRSERDRIRSAADAWRRRQNEAPT